MWALLRPLRDVNATCKASISGQSATLWGVLRLIRGSAPPAERGGVSRPAERGRPARRTASAVARSAGAGRAARLSRGERAALAPLFPLSVAVLLRAARRRRRSAVVVVRSFGRRCSVGRALRFRSAAVVVGGRCLGGSGRCAPSLSVCGRWGLVGGAAVLGGLGRGAAAV